MSCLSEYGVRRSAPVRGGAVEEAVTSLPACPSCPPRNRRAVDKEPGADEAGGGDTGGKEGRGPGGSACGVCRGALQASCRFAASFRQLEWFQSGALI